MLSTVVLLIACLSGCGNSKDSFQKGSYQADDFFSQSIETMVQSNQNLEIHFETDLYQENDSKQLAEEIRKNYDKMVQVGGKLVEPLQVYIISANHKSGLCAGSKKIICTMKEVKNGELRQAMVQEAFQINDLWKVLGLNYYLFKNEDRALTINNQNLKKMYENKDKQEFLNLLPFYFMPFFTDNQDVVLAKNTACSLTEYQIMNGSLKEFLTGKYDVERKELWLDSIGIKNVQLSDPEKLKISIRTDENQNIEITKDHHSFLYEADSWMNGSKELTSFFNDLDNGFQTILDGMEQDGDEMKSYLEECWKQPFHIVFVDSEEKTNTKDTIYLKKGDDPIFEIIGQFLKNLKKQDQWMADGFASYFSRENEPVWLLDERKEESLSLLNKEAEYESLSKKDQKIADEVRDQYERSAPSPVTEDNFNYWIYYQAKGIVGLKDRIQSGKTITELDNPEAYALSQYLVQTFGMDECLSYLRGDETFKEVFRSDLRTVIKKFLRSIEA